DGEGGGDRIGIAFRALGIDVDEAHLHGGQRVLEDASVFGTIFLDPVQLGFGRDPAFLARAGVVLVPVLLALAVAMVAAQPFGFRTPVPVLVRLPGVFA